jgi:hypothetical protein
MMEISLNIRRRITSLAMQCMARAKGSLYLYFFDSSVFASYSISSLLLPFYSIPCFPFIYHPSNAHFVVCLSIHHFHYLTLKIPFFNNRGLHVTHEIIVFCTITIRPPLRLLSPLSKHVPYWCPG